MPLERTDSDIDDVWSEDAEEIEPGPDLTEFEFRPPPKKTEPPAAPSRSQPPPVAPPPPPLPASLTADLEVPEAGASVDLDMTEDPSLPELQLAELAPPPPPSPPPSYPKKDPYERDARTMIADAEGAAIARAVSRSLLTNAGPNVVVPPMLEREDVSKVLMGRRAEEFVPPVVPRSPSPSPPPQPRSATPSVPPTLESRESREPREPNEPLELGLEANAAQPMDPPLELAFDPHQREEPPAEVRVPTYSRAMPIAPVKRALPMRTIVLVLLAIVIAAFVIRVVIGR